MEYLEKYNKMKFAIQECHKVDEIKLIRDKAEAYRYAMIQAKESPDLIRKAEEIKLRAERRAGELLPEQITIGTKSHPTTLSDIGVTKDQSSSWQRIASIPEEKFEEYIQDKKEITTSGAVKLARKLQRENEFEGTPELPEGKYNVLYADPPWSYGDTLVEGYGSVERHYTSMTIQELCELNIEDITDDNAVLFLWVTSPLLEECFEVIKAWGFKYKSSFIWDKVKHNWGHYNSVRHEFLLVCTKGSFLKQNKELEDSVISIERSKEHSEKPEYFRELIEKMYPNSKKIELFARRKIDNWDTWGAEIK